MNTEQKSITVESESGPDGDTTIEKGFEQMDMIYRSRCVQPPLGKNVTVRDIESFSEKPK